MQVAANAFFRPDYPYVLPYGLSSVSACRFPPPARTIHQVHLNTSVKTWTKIASRWRVRCIFSPSGSAPDRWTPSRAAAAGGAPRGSSENASRSGRTSGRAEMTVQVTLEGTLTLKQRCHVAQTPPERPSVSPDSVQGGGLT